MAPPSSTLAWKNPMDGGAWQAALHGVAKGTTERLYFHFSLSCIGEGNGDPKKEILGTCPNMILLEIKQFNKRFKLNNLHNLMTN